MSNAFLRYSRTGLVTAVALPFDLEAVIQCWLQVRVAMLKHVPSGFTRSEWAYIVSFLSKESLLEPFGRSFGRRLSEDDFEKPNFIARPVSEVAVWLPNNVSLLGPLMLILLSLSGARLRMKAGSHAADLTGEFLEFVQRHCTGSELREYLSKRVVHSAFGREDPRNAEMARDAKVRIVFGSDAAVADIENLAHPVGSHCFAFSDHRSEAWIESGCWDESAVTDLVKVFSIYGQAGCTSPSRVILLNGSRKEALALSSAIRLVWPKVVKRDPPQNLASANVAAWQVDRALGWQSEMIERNLGVVSVGDFTLEADSTLMNLRIIPAGLADASDNLPSNIQTIGYVLANPGNDSWLRLVTESHVLRFVPLRAMHFFGSVWDGNKFWESIFEYVQFSI